MPWNQPGSGNNGKDPWGGGGNRGNNQGPPDLDEIVKNIQNKLGSVFGGSGGSSSSSSGGSKSPAPNKFVIMLVVVLAFVAWVFQCLYTVQEGEESIELLFGRYQETKSAGLTWHWWPIEQYELINVQKINTVEVGYRANQRSRAATTVPAEALMLTADENIIDIQFAVQYDIKDPSDLLFFVGEYVDRDGVENVVRQATESAVREIVGRNTMDFAITEGRAEIAQQTKSLLQQILDRYSTGINIRAVEMQNAQPPAQVKDAFDDAVRAREDEERLKNEAEAYSNDVIPRARGAAARITQEAEAYRASIAAKAEGETARFEQVLNEYEKAPEVTRDRLYIESMEEVLGNSTKLMIDQQSGGNSLFYLPLDQLMGKQQSGTIGSRNTLPRVQEGLSGAINSASQSTSGRNGRTGRTSRGQN